MARGDLELSPVTDREFSLVQSQLANHGERISELEEGAAGIKVSVKLLQWLFPVLVLLGGIVATVARRLP